MALEGEFGACLLMVGPPNMLYYPNRAGPNPHYSLSADEPASSMGYRYRCESWFNIHVKLRPTVNTAAQSFPYWWMHYKRWLFRHSGGV